MNAPQYHLYTYDVREHITVTKGYWVRSYVRTDIPAIRSRGQRPLPGVRVKVRLVMSVVTVGHHKRVNAQLYLQSQQGGSMIGDTPNQLQLSPTN